MCETNASCGQFVDVWRVIGLATVATKALDTDVISQDKQDVWFLGDCLTESNGSKTNEENEILVHVCLQGTLIFNLA
jgi:hypothetical protein